MPQQDWTLPPLCRMCCCSSCVLQAKGQSSQRLQWLLQGRVWRWCVLLDSARGWALAASPSLLVLLCEWP